MTAFQKIRIRTRAERFFLSCLGASGRPNEAIDAWRGARALQLCVDAFTLYALEWPGHDIGAWKWPWTILPGQPCHNEIHGNESWTVLFRQALALLDIPIALKKENV